MNKNSKMVSHSLDRFASWVPFDSLTQFGQVPARITHKR